MDVNKSDFAMDIIVKHPSAVFFRRPKSKRKRIVKKWMKRNCNWHVVLLDTKCYVVGDNTIICSPDVASLINKEILDTNNLKQSIGRNSTCKINI